MEGRVMNAASLVMTAWQAVMVDLNGPGLAAPHSALRHPKRNKFIPAIGLQWASIRRPGLPRLPTPIRLEVCCLQSIQRRHTPLWGQQNAA
jgi:hypothetical protein